jgi:AraC family transcriptional activator of pobA
VPLWLARAVVWRLAQAAARQAQAAAPGRPGGHAALHTRFLALVEAHYLEHSGKSALQLVHERVLREACRRLTYLVAPVSNLAFELGFDDPAYFCRFFKRRTGLSPREYRRSVS